MTIVMKSSGLAPGALHLDVCYSSVLLSTSGSVPPPREHYPSDKQLFAKGNNVY